jgi:dehydrogenase/reductase SDR family member 12
MIGGLRTLADLAIETSIVGSFTNVGFKARNQLYGLGPVEADLSGQRAVVTGSTSGIGKAVARRLLALGADVVVTSRSPERAEAVAAELDGAGNHGRATGIGLETADFATVLDAVDQLRAGPRIDMLCHNAGALSASFATNDYGIERTLASHLVGPYLLTRQIRSHCSAGARVVWMASGGLYTQGLDVDRLNLIESGYRGAVAYARAKRAQVELVAHLGPLWAPEVVMQAMHPGWVDTPGIKEGLPGFGRLLHPLLRSPEQGADTMVWLAVTGGRGPAGRFWLDRRPRSTRYLPTTGTDNDERRRLVDWLELTIAPVI